MLARGILERVLRLSNDTVPEYRYRLTLEKLLLHVKTGTISPPDVLDDAERLLTALVRYGYEQRAAQFPAAPPAWERQCQGRRWRIEEWPPAPSPRPSWVRMIAVDPVTGITLMAIPQPEVVAYTSKKIFNDFFALDLPGLPTYPAPKDRDKILAFLASYGPDFLPYPFPDRAAEDQLDYFSEFNRQYQTFTHVVQYLAKPPAPPPVLPRDGYGSSPYDPVDNALTNLNDGLDQIKPRLRRLPDGTIVTTFEPTHGLYLCYVTLCEAVNNTKCGSSSKSHQPPFKVCALASCQRPFIPQRNDQTCCTPMHATALRQARYRRTR